jgi:hypothetical protein
MRAARREHRTPSRQPPTSLCLRSLERDLSRSVGVVAMGTGVRHRPSRDDRDAPTGGQTPSAAAQPSRASESKFAQGCVFRASRNARNRPFVRLGRWLLRETKLDEQCVVIVKLIDGRDLVAVERDDRDPILLEGLARRRDLDATDLDRVSSRRSCARGTGSRKPDSSTRAGCRGTRSFSRSACTTLILASRGSRAGFSGRCWSRLSQSVGSLVPNAGSLGYSHEAHGTPWFGGVRESPRAARLRLHEPLVPTRSLRLTSSTVSSQQVQAGTPVGSLFEFH